MRNAAPKHIHIELDVQRRSTLEEQIEAQKEMLRILVNGNKESPWVDQALFKANLRYHWAKLRELLSQRAQKRVLEILGNS